MPWSGSAPNKTFSRNTGVYTGTSAWQQTDAAARGIRADDHDVHDEDLATGINTALAKDGGNKPTADIDWGGYGITNLGDLSSATEASVASATTTNVLGQDSLFVSVTGTTTITSLGTGAKTVKFVRFTGALTLTHNATSLILPGGANITTAAGDTMIVVSDASSNARVMGYQRAAVVPLQNSLPYPPAEVLLTSGTVSSAATLDIVLSGYTGFRAIKFALSRFIPSTNNVALWMRFSTNGGSSYDAGASDYNYATYYNFSSDDSSSGDTKIIVIPVFSIFGISNASSGGADMEITLFDHTSTARYSGILASGLPVFDSVGRQKVDSFGSRLTAQDTDAVRFLFSSGDIASGTYAVYGLL